SQAPVFDRRRLVQELLSLGNARIDQAVAENIGEQVEAELKRRNVPSISPELVSELVQFKLEELGLIEIRRRRSRRAPLADPEVTVTPHPQPEYPEATPTLSGEFPLANGLARKVEKTALPTLEKFLAPTEARSTRPTAPLPPKANLKVSARTLKKLVATTEGPMGREAETIATARLEAVFEDIAKLAAGVQTEVESVPASTLAVQFFNSMANQEFYPHHPLLLDLLGLQADSVESPVEIELAEEPSQRASALRQAAKAWKESREVCFLLPQGQTVGWTGEDFERFLDKAEKTILELPEGSEMPRRVAFRLRLDDGRALDFARRALSGKYYPKFAFDWLLPEEASFGDSTAELLDEVLKVTWKKSEPSLVFSAKAFGAPDLSRLGFPESVRPGGSPALSPTGEAPLGSLNLSIIGSGGDVDWAKLKRMTRSAVRFLDGLAAPKAEAVRALGLGAMGFAELLAKLGIPYDSEAAVDLAEKIARFMKQEAGHAAQALAEESAAPLRHSALLNFQSEAGLAELADVSPGFLPLERLIEAGKVTPLVRQIAERRKVWTPQLEIELLQWGSLRRSPSAPKPLRRLFASQQEIDAEWVLRIKGALERHSDAYGWTSPALEEDTDLQELKARLAQLRVYGLRAFRLPQNPDFEIPNEEELAEAAPLELEVPALETESTLRADEAIATEAAVASLALTLEELAAEASETALAANESEAAEEEEKTEVLFDLIAEPEAPALPSDSLAAAILGIGQSPAPQGIKPRERPEVLQANTRVIHTGCGPLNVSFARDSHGPYEVRAQLGQPGTCAHTQTEAISRLISLCLSSGIDQRLVYEQIRGMRCETSTYDRGERILGCVDGIAKVFERESNLNAEEPAFAGFEEDEEITAVTRREDLN
ncbi:MAG TPA: hypothetical protein VJP40_06580, partial [bacterium]|nr:hypothetical protein [bacterium]